ncbi:hypothetical protein C8R43DRAFT_1136224 [Mycena crocata]|nr:hypothetical protein C8R43DRAFT_1136224 [Mycena crocata]
MELPDVSLRLQRIAALIEMKLVLEERRTEAQAQLDSIRNRFDLDDDDLAYEVEMGLAEEAMVWAGELETLEWEHQYIQRCIRHSERHTEPYVPQFPQPEEEEPIVHVPIHLSAPDNGLGFRRNCSRYKLAHPPHGNMRKKRILRKPSAPQDTPTEIQQRTISEIRERRRLEAVDATNTEVGATWVSGSWNAAMDGFLEPEAPRDVEEPDDPEDGVSMDSGLSDESDGADSVDPSRIICERSYPRGDPLGAEWDALTDRLWPIYQMPAGMRHSVQMEHPSRPPRNAEIPKVQLFESISTPSESGAGESCMDIHESLAVEVDREADS